MKETTTTGYILLTCFTLPGPFILILGFLLLKSRIKFIRNSVFGKGVIVDYEKRKGKGSRSATTYAPIIEFSYGGNKHKFTSMVSSSDKTFNVGKEVEIRFNPQKPEEAEIPGFLHTWAAPIAVLFLGGIFTLTLVLLQISYLKK